MKNKISIVIPTYNRPRYLFRCLYALTCQKNSNFNVIVSDNSHKTINKEVISHFQNQLNLKYICNPKNLGSIENFINGANLVETEYFTFVSDDDFLLQDYISKFYQIYLKSQEYEVIFQSSICISHNENLENLLFLNEKREFCEFESFVDDDIIRKMIDCTLPNVWTSCAIKLSRYKSVGGLPNNCGPFIDNIFLMSCAYKSKCYFVNDINSILISHVNSISNANHSIDPNWKVWKKKYKNYY